jgi:hypothetical protein
MLPGMRRGSSASGGHGPGAGGDAPGAGGDAPGSSGDAPGSSGGAPGAGGNAPGAGGGAPGAGSGAPGSSGDQYEPLPGLAGLPAWIWGRLPPAGKVGVALLPVVAVGLVLALGPGIEQGKEERASAEAERLERARAERVERQRREQQPRFARGEPAAASLPARRHLLAEASVAVRRDARARVQTGALSGPIRRVQCEPYPRTVDRPGAEENPSRRFGRYACLAVTAAFGATAEHEAGAIGHPYRVRIDFDSGRYAFCKVAGRAGEGSIGQAPVVRVPAACGGA